MHRTNLTDRLSTRYSLAFRALGTALFFALLFSLTGAADGQIVAGRDYLTMSPSAVTVDAGDTVRFDVVIDSGAGPLSPSLGLAPGRDADAASTKALERIRFSADGGEVEVLFQPTFSRSTAAATLTVGEPGVYVFRAVSTYYPDRFVESTVIVRPATGSRLFVHSEPGVVLSGTGDTATAEVWLIHPDGTVDTDPPISWSSSDPHIVDVDSAGRMTAITRSGSAILTASYGTLPPAKISVSVATLQLGTRLLDSGSIVYVDGDQVLLDESIGRTVFIGNILVSGHGRGLMARVLGMQRKGTDYLATVEPVSFADAFRSIRIQTRSPWIEETTGDGLGFGGAPLKSGFSSLDCDVTSGIGAGLSVDMLGFEWTRRFQVKAEYDHQEGRAPTFAMWIEGEFGVEIGTVNIGLNVTEGVTIECESQGGPPVTFPVLGFGPISLSFKVTPKVGASFSVGMNGELSLTTPSVSRTISDIRRGVGFNGSTLYGINSEVDSGKEINWPSDDPFQASQSVSVDVELYFAGIVAFGFPYVNFLTVDMLENRAGGFATLGMDVPYDVNHPAYSGPEWSLGRKFSASLAPLFADFDFLPFLERLDIGTGGSIDVTLISQTFPYAASPEVSMSGITDDPGSPSRVTLNVSAPGAGGGQVELLAWPAATPGAAPSSLGTFGLDGNGGALVTLAWPDDALMVRPRVYHGLFGHTVGKPYASSEAVTIGGGSDAPTPPPCDGPDCSPTTPGGPDRPGGYPGGGMGNPGDDGSGSFPGSIGGSGAWGDGSGSGGAGSNGGSGSTGDPHIISLDGLRYNFQAQGEFILAAAATGGGVVDPAGDLHIQVRQKQVAPGFSGAINTAVAARVGSSVVEIYAVPGAGESHLYVDDAAYSGNGTLLLGPAGIDGRIEIHGGTYTVLWADGSRLRVQLGYSHLDLGIRLADARLGGVVGLMGVFDGDRDNDFTPRGGSPIAPPINFHQLYVQHGSSWQVGAGEALLDDGRGGGTPGLTLPDGFPDDVIDPSIFEEAELRCRIGGVYLDGVLEACRFDVALLLSVPTPDYALIGSIIEGHYWSQFDIFGAPGHIEVFVVGPAQVEPGGTVTFVASVQGADDPSLVWTTSGGGTLDTAGSPSVSWTAGTEPGVVEITATSVVDPSASATVHVLVGHAGPENVGAWLDLSPAGDGSWNPVGPAPATWVSQDAFSQTTWLVSPHDYRDVIFSGSFSATGADDDFLGFLFGYQTDGTACGSTCDVDFFLFDWKRSHQNEPAPLNTAESGRALHRVYGNVDLDQPAEIFWRRDAVAGQNQILMSDFGGAGWVPGQEYRFEVHYARNYVRVYVGPAGGADLPLIYEATAATVFGDPTAEFPAGRVGFYNYSQQEALYGNVEIRPLGETTP